MTVITLASALARLPLPANAKWPDGVFDEELIHKHDVSVEIFAPRGQDRQTPHTRDELYLVAAGNATFTCEGEPDCEVKAGDIIEVPAGVPHCFSLIGQDFATWVVFFGPPLALPQS